MRAFACARFQWSSLVDWSLESVECYSLESSLARYW